MQLKVDFLQHYLSTGMLSDTGGDAGPEWMREIQPRPQP